MTGYLPYVDLSKSRAETYSLWPVLFDMSEQHPGSWTLIGGQMTLLHGMEADMLPPRASGDLDLLVDVEVDPAALVSMVNSLLDIGFKSYRGVPGPDGVDLRFTKDDVIVDLLAPDELVHGTDLTTYPGARTIETAGGSQALRRTEYVDAHFGTRSGHIPRPSLLGSIMCKAAAVEHGYGVPPGEKHLVDCAFLLCLIQDPHKTSEEMTTGDRNLLKRIAQLADPNHYSWTVQPDSIRYNGISALEVLCNG